MEFASVSAIIATKNRPQDLRLTIRTLLNQTRLPREVIVVDQSPELHSYNATQEEFRAFDSAISSVPTLKYIHDPLIVGVSAARNRGMEVAEEEIWLFFDDDVDIEPEFVKELLDVYATNPEIAGVSGIITNYGPLPWAFRAWLKIFTCGPFQDKRLPLYWKAEKMLDKGLQRVHGFTGALMSFRAGVARGNRFDTTIRTGEEDVDFCLNLGGNPLLVIAPRARLRHMRSPIGRSGDLWLKRFSLSQSFFYRRYWDGHLKNRLCFWWLCIGLGLAATLSALRRLSFRPWNDLLAGMRAGWRTAESGPAH